MQLFRTTETVKFIYESEAEKMGHKAFMEQQGFEDSGQVKININNSMQNPKYEWYGRYIRQNKINMDQFQFRY